MQAKFPVLAVFATLGLACAPMLAQASGYISRGYIEPSSAVHGDGDYGYGYGEVLEARPIVRAVREPDLREVCHEQPVDYYHAGRPHSPAGTLVGALIGGVIGHAVAGGGHRGYHGGYHRSYQRHSTAAGAAVGAAIGYQSSRGPDHVQRSYEQRCQVQRSWRPAEEVVGYEVTYRYRGEIYQTRSEAHPGESIPVRVGAHSGY